LNHSITYGDILEYLYNHSGDRKYVDFAFRLYNDFTKYVDRVGTGDDGGADDALDNLINSNTMFLGHGPHTAEGLRMPLWLSMFAKDSTDAMQLKYELAVANIPVKLNKSLSPTKGLVTDPSKFESVNGKYSCGNFPYEYCSLAETLNSLSSMCRKFVDKESAESAEILFFNAAQGATFFRWESKYLLVCDNVDKAVASQNWRDQYSALHGIRCCNLNAARIAPNYVASMWMKTEDKKH